MKLLSQTLKDPRRPSALHWFNSQNRPAHWLNANIYLCSVATITGDSITKEFDKSGFYKALWLADYEITEPSASPLFIIDTAVMLFQTLLTDGINYNFINVFSHDQNTRVRHFSVAGIVKPSIRQSVTKFAINELIKEFIDNEVAVQ